MAIWVLLLLYSWGCTETEEPELPAHIRDIENLTSYPADPEPVYDSIDFVDEQVFGDTDTVWPDTLKKYEPLPSDRGLVVPVAQMRTIKRAQVVRIYLNGNGTCPENHPA